MGRVQADGRSLELARLIQPYWLLVMPEGAQGVERVVEVPVTDPEPAPPAPASQEQDTSPDQGQQDQPGQDAVPRAESVPGAQVPAVGALLAASVLSLLAYQRRRAVGGRPQDDATELERRLLVSADPERLERLDRILRGLGTLEPRPAPCAVLTGRPCSGGWADGVSTCSAYSATTKARAIPASCARERCQVRTPTSRAASCSGPCSRRRGGLPRPATTSTSR